MTVSAKDTVGFLVDHLKTVCSPKPRDGKPVFWLGAGCSTHDGVPLNAELLRLALPDDRGTWGSPQYRFDVFCDNLGADRSRADFLTPYVERPLKPDSPYHGLTRLMRDGYADVVFTFNIDDLLEQAFQEAGLREHRDYQVILVPELVPNVVVQRLSPHQGPRLRIVKLHGDYRWGINCMTSTEITQYPEVIRKAVEVWSGQPAVVCGYSFFHLNVLEAFSRTGSYMVYANLRFPDAPMVLSLMSARNPNSAWFVDGDLGSFGGFVAALEDGLRP
ncbi:SIR2 family protein [Streptomyces sp. NPDC029044]|uniref:SIR2 family protein n=1 Tax=Streptomyces sp. NPDC029044 TaxID=3157198 RepID=UPI0033C526DA